MDPASVQFAFASGIGDMYVDGDTFKQPRFGLAERFVLVSLLVRFTGGSGSADLTLRRDHPDESGLFDFREHVFEAVGTGGDDVVFRVPKDEAAHYTYRGDQGEALFLEWTDPDGSKDTRWAVEARMAVAERLTQTTAAEA